MRHMRRSGKRLAFWLIVALVATHAAVAGWMAFEQYRNSVQNPPAIIHWQVAPTHIRILAAGDWGASVLALAADACILIAICHPRRRPRLWFLVASVILAAWACIGFHHQNRSGYGVLWPVFEYTVSGFGDTSITMPTEPWQRDGFTLHWRLDPLFRCGIVTGVAGLLGAVFILGLYSRSDHRVCLRCGYDLRNSAGRYCPECGLGHDAVRPAAAGDEG